MTTRPCCCTNEGDGHRCPQAWGLIHEAQRRLLYRDWPALHGARQHYTQHLVTAQLHPLGSDAWPDLCTITMDDDPRCPQCSKETTP